MWAVQGVIQSYPWGATGNDNAVAYFASRQGCELDESAPKAELWLGAHPNGSALAIGESVTNSSSQPLKTVLADHKTEMPYLLKVLSIGSCLSLQLHPDRETAQKLHELDPEHYKDPYDKPEMCIALEDGFELFCGFLKARDICAIGQVVPFVNYLINQVRKTPAKSDSIDEEFYNPLSEMTESEFLQALLAKFYSVPSEMVKLAIQETLAIQPDAIEQKKLKRVQKATSSFVRGVINTISGTGVSEYQTLIEECLMTFRYVQSHFPQDRGCFASFILAKHCLNKGQAMGLNSNTIHAYLKGECVEIMKCSDNVVRAGLTDKYQDTTTLLKQTTYERYMPARLRTHSSVVSTSAKSKAEFQLIRPLFTEAFRVGILRFTCEGAAAVNLEQLFEESENNSSPVTEFLCLCGQGEIHTEKGGVQNISAGQCTVAIRTGITRIVSAGGKEDKFGSLPYTFVLLIARGTQEEETEKRRRASLTASSLEETPTN